MRGGSRLLKSGRQEVGENSSARALEVVLSGGLVGKGRGEVDNSFARSSDMVIAVAAGFDIAAVGLAGSAIVAGLLYTMADALAQATRKTGIEQDRAASGRNSPDRAVKFIPRYVTGLRLLARVVREERGVPVRRDSTVPGKVEDKALGRFVCPLHLVQRIEHGGVCSLFVRKERNLKPVRLQTLLHRFRIVDAAFQVTPGSELGIFIYADYQSVVGVGRRYERCEDQRCNEYCGKVQSEPAPLESETHRILLWRCGSRFKNNAG